MKIKALSMVVALCCAIGATSAPAATVVVDNPLIANEIRKLNVLGTFYNVFFNNAVDSTFVGDAIGATAARAAINAALNGSTAAFVRIRNNGASVDNFGVMDSGSTTVRSASFSVAGNWKPEGSTAFKAPIAQFELATIPLPAGLPLLLAGIGVLGVASRCKRKAA